MLRKVFFFLNIFYFLFLLPWETITPLILISPPLTRQLRLFKNWMSYSHHSQAKDESKKKKKKKKNNLKSSPVIMCLHIILVVQTIQKAM